MVIISGLSGLLKAYKSVLSATGSFEIRGASLWLEAMIAVQFTNKNISTVLYILFKIDFIFYIFINF